VETGPRYRDLWVIEKGVKAGESVIVSGLQYVRAGTPVAAKPAPASPAALASR
jgi:multidrug efflux pump subunit AcrA (membrane-fusion protein)